MTLKQDMKVYYETFPESLKYCDFCSKKFRTVAGLRNHAVKMHAAEMDAAREEALNHRVVLGSPMDVWNDVATDYPEE